MATYILVHGGSVSTETWNRLTGTHDYPEGGQLGGACWRYSVLALEKAGHRVFAPDLADENTHGLTDHVDQVCALIREKIKNRGQVIKNRGQVIVIVFLEESK